MVYDGFSGDQLRRAREGYISHTDREIIEFVIRQLLHEPVFSRADLAVVTPIGIGTEFDHFGHGAADALVLTGTAGNFQGAVECPVVAAVSGRLSLRTP